MTNAVLGVAASQNHCVHTQNYFFPLQRPSSPALQAHLVPEALKVTEVSEGAPQGSEE